MVSTLRSPITQIFTSIGLHTGKPVGMWTCPRQVLAAALTLSQPGWANLPTLLYIWVRSWHMMEACFNLKQTQSKNRESNALEFDTKTVGS